MYIGKDYALTYDGGRWMDHEKARRREERGWHAAVTACKLQTQPRLVTAAAVSRLGVLQERDPPSRQKLEKYGNM